MFRYLHSGHVLRTYHTGSEFQRPAPAEFTQCSPPENAGRRPSLSIGSSSVNGRSTIRTIVLPATMSTRPLGFQNVSRCCASNANTYRSWCWYWAPCDIEAPYPVRRKIYGELSSYHSGMARRGIASSLLTVSLEYLSVRHSMSRKSFASCKLQSSFLQYSIWPVGSSLHVSTIP